MTICMTYYPHIDYYEPAVNFTLRHLIKPGMTIFDVGANEGVLTVVSGRATGPSGKVIAFEGSPRILEMLHKNLADNHASNCHIVNAYISENHNEVMPIYYNTDSSVADSLIGTQGAQAGAQVRTIRLDTFIKETNLTPDLIKVDVEGAEPIVLESMSEVFSKGLRPLVILESWSDSQSCKILEQHGYKAFDLHDMNEIDMSVIPDLNTNILFFPNTMDCPLPSITKGLEIETIDGQAFKKSGKSYNYRSQNSLDTGSYVFEITSTKPDLKKDIKLSFYVAGYLSVLHCSDWAHILSHYKRQPFSVDIKGTYEVNLENIPTRDFTCKIIKIA